MCDWIATVVVKNHRVLLLVALVIAGCSVIPARQLRMDWSVDKMFPPGEPLVSAYHLLQERFGGNKIALAVYRDPELWDRSGVGLERLSEISQRIEQVEGVEAVLSLAELHEILETMRGPMQLFDFSSDKLPPLLDQEDELAQAFADVFAGYTHKPGGEYVAIACMLAPNEAESPAGPEAHARTISDLRSLMATLPSPASNGLVTGEPVLVVDGFKMVQRDGWRLGLTSTILLTVVLLLCFRSIRWTLIPIAVVHWALLTTQAVLGLMQLELTMISSTLTAVVTVVGVATSMHVLLKFQRQRRLGHDRQAALKETYAVLLAPVMWACVTDAVGFAALMFASVGPVQDFGMMMAVGSLMVLLAIILVVPGLGLFGRLDADPSTPRLDMIIRLQLRHVLDRVLENRTVGLLVLTILFVFGAWGCIRMEIETDFTKNFQASSAIVRGYDVIESELGGAGVWDIMLPSPHVISAEYLDQVVKLQERLRAISIKRQDGELRLTKVLSVADAERAARKGTLIGNLPVSARIAGMQQTMPTFTGALLSRNSDINGNYWLRIMLRSQERAPAVDKRTLIERVKNEVAEFTATDDWTRMFDSSSQMPTAQLAGYHVMLSSLVASVLKDQWRCFMLATGGILLVMLLATRSLTLALIALIPNALPVLLVLGTMGWLGMRVNMGAAMIAAVSLGLSVDSSIHYLLHYQRHRRSGERPIKALRSAQENVGLAVVLATIALVAGFVSLCTSEFVPTVVFGVLASLTMLGSLLGNLVILPMLIRMMPDGK